MKATVRNRVAPKRARRLRRLARWNRFVERVNAPFARYRGYRELGNACIQVESFDFEEFEQYLSGPSGTVDMEVASLQRRPPEEKKGDFARTYGHTTGLPRKAGWR